MPMIDIRAHGGKFGGGGLKSNPTKELLVSATPYSRTAYNHTYINYIIAVSDKYIAYRNDQSTTSEYKVMDRKTRQVILSHTLPGGWTPYVRPFILCGAFNGDWLYFTIANGSSYDVAGINVVTGVSSYKTFGNTNRVECIKLCSDGYVYGVSYGTISKWDNAGNRLYMANWSSSGGGGERVFDVIDGELIVGLNTNGRIVRFNPSNGAKIGEHTIFSSSSVVTHFFKAGNYFYAVGSYEVALFRLNPATWSSDISLTEVYSAYKIDEQTFLAFKRDGSYPAGASLYNLDLTVKALSVTGYHITAHELIRKNNYFEVVQGYNNGASYEPTVEQSVVRIYYK
jgi:hypothetical protein